MSSLLFTKCVLLDPPITFSLAMRMRFLLMSKFIVFNVYGISYFAKETAFNEIQLKRKDKLKALSNVTCHEGACEIDLNGSVILVR
jgi:hypothetical protein